MSIWEQLLLIVGLAADGFAASVCMGLCLPEDRTRRAATVVCAVTAFHILFFILGHICGSLCADILCRAAPYLAGGILLLLGVLMLLDARKHTAAPEAGTLSAGRILALSFATSIDAASVGFTFAMLDAPLWTPAALVLAVMGGLAAGGVSLGRFLGLRFCRHAKLAGGVILCLFGLKNILL